MGDTQRNSLFAHGNPRPGRGLMQRDPENTPGPWRGCLNPYPHGRFRMRKAGVFSLERWWEAKRGVCFPCRKEPPVGERSGHRGLKATHTSSPRGAQCSPFLQWQVGSPGVGCHHGWSLRLPDRTVPNPHPACTRTKIKSNEMKKHHKTNCKIQKRNERE